MDYNKNVAYVKKMSSEETLIILKASAGGFVKKKKPTIFLSFNSITRHHLSSQAKIINLL